MLKKITLSLLLCAGALGTQAASAQNGCDSYYGLDVGNGKLQSSDSDLLSLKNVQGTLGCQLTNNFGVEARLGLSAEENSNLFGDPDITQASVLARLGYKGEKVLVYGLAGGGYIDVDQINGDEFSPVFGVGLELFGSARTAIHFGYTVQATESKSIDHGLFNLGYRHYFADLF